MPLNNPGVLLTTAPAGTELAPVGRSIARKLTAIETITPLLANQKFTGPWHDSQADGTIFVMAYSYSNVTGVANGLSIDLSDDYTNAGFTITGVQAIEPGANTLAILSCAIRTRYWRVTYTNGATNQASLEVTSCAFNNFPTANGANSGTVNSPSTSVTNSQSSVNVSVDNQTTWVTWGGGAAPADIQMYGGAFSGTASATKQGYSKARTPTVFHSATATASGNTAVWTPLTSNKFRLLKFKIQVTADAATTSGAEITISFQDSTTDIGLSHVVYVPVTGATALNASYDSGWLDLGNFGVLSAAAGNVLNVNLSTALSAGKVSVITAGTEE